MPVTALLLALAAQAGEPEPIVVTGSAWAPFISPMGEPFRSHRAGDDPLARWFNRADIDGNGILIPAEMQADGLRFFATLDTDGDKQILPPEMVTYEWEAAPEIQVNARWRDPRGTGPRKKGKDPRRSYDPSGLQGAARYGLLNIPQPVAAADTDLNRAVTVNEFSAAAGYRFQLLDKNRDQQLDLAELRLQAPLPRKDQKRAKIDENYRDPRVGTTVQLED